MPYLLFLRDTFTLQCLLIGFGNMGPKIVNLDDTRGDTDHKATTCRKAMSISNKVYIK